VNEIKFSLGLSAAGHAVGLGLLILLLPARIPPAPEPLATGGIEVVFAPLPKPEEPQPPIQAEIPPPQVETPPPESEPPPPTPEQPVVAPEPPPPASVTPVPVVQPPPPPKPTVKPPPKPVHHHLEQAAPNPTPAPPQPTQAAVAAPQTAYAPTPVPAPVPSNVVSLGYRALLSAWLEGHKRYPDSARQRGEEGRAVLRFAVDRSGRVLNFAVAQSSGYPDLDASIEEMMRGALLPPFPAGMDQPHIDVSVTIRFSLAR
jgi:periplasmic protein TonB